MRIAVAPASPKTAVAAIRVLLKHNVTTNDTVTIRAFYRDTRRAPVEFTSNPNFEARKAKLDDSSTLDFSDVDVVVAITPPGIETDDVVKHAERVSGGVKEAIEKAGCVKKLVLLSSVGAHHSEGVGEIKTNNRAENIFSTTHVPSITFIRCAYFMENWTASIDTLKAPDPFFFSTITPLDYKVPMVAVQDIGAVLAREALAGKKTSRDSPYIYELHGPKDYDPRDVQAALSKAMGRDVAIKPVEKHQLPEFFARVFPPKVASAFVEMTVGFLPGGKMILEPDAVDREVVRGTTRLDEALGEIVKAFL